MKIESRDMEIQDTITHVNFEVSVVDLRKTYVRYSTSLTLLNVMDNKEVGDEIVAAIQELEKSIMEYSCPKSNRKVE